MASFNPSQDATIVSPSLVDLLQNCRSRSTLESIAVPHPEMGAQPHADLAAVLDEAMAIIETAEAEGFFIGASADLRVSIEHQVQAADERVVSAEQGANQPNSDGGQHQKRE